MANTIVNLASFQEGNGSVFEAAVATAGSIAIISTHSYAPQLYALFANPGGASTGYAAFSGWTTAGLNANLTANPLYASFYMNPQTILVGGSDEVFRFVSSTSTLKMSCRLNTDGTLGLYDSTDTLIANGTTVLAANSYVRIDAKCANGTTGAYELKINGNVELSGTANVAATNVSRLILGKFVNHNSATGYSLFYSDLWLDTAGYAPDRFRVGLLLPSSNGGTMSWTGGTGASDYTQINEQPSSTSNYVQDPASTSLPVVGLFNLAGATGTSLANATIYGCRVSCVVSDASTAVTNSFTFGMTSNSVDDLTVSRNTSASSVIDELGHLVINDPNTSAAWTPTALLAAQIKISEATTAVSTKVYWAAVNVGYVPASSGPIATNRRLVTKAGRQRPRPSLYDEAPFVDSTGWL